MSKIGIQMYTLRETMKTKEGLEETLRRVAEIGYQNVQITLPGFVSSEEGAAMLAHYGLRADSAMAAFDGNIRERNLPGDLASAGTLSGRLFRS